MPISLRPGGFNSPNERIKVKNSTIITDIQPSIPGEYVPIIPLKSELLSTYAHGC